MLKHSVTSFYNIFSVLYSWLLYPVLNLFLCASEYFEKQSDLLVRKKQKDLLRVSTRNKISQYVNFGESKMSRPYSSTPAKCQKVLIVEDHPVCQKFFSKLLEQRGHNCDVAGNGMIAIEMVKEALSRNQINNEHKVYDAILMDLVMPVMDGFESTKGIRKIGYTGPIIGLTACAILRDEEEFYNSGATLVVFKPFKIPNMFELLDSL